MNHLPSNTAFAIDRFDITGSINTEALMRKVLYIDDDADMHWIVSAFINSSYRQVVCAENGKVGLEIAKNLYPDLIISDLNMPQMNGYDLLNELRKDPATAKIPFIFLTSDCELESYQKAMNLGAKRYLNKPVDFEELVKIVERFI